jgi:hypothetical protein
MTKDSELDILTDFLLDWSKANDFSIVLPNCDDEDKIIDFININLKTKTIYIGELGIEELLTEVG